MGILPFLLYCLLGIAITYGLYQIYMWIINNFVAYQLSYYIPNLDFNIYHGVDLLTHILTQSSYYGPYYTIISSIYSILLGLLLGGSLSLILHPNKKTTEKGGLIFGIWASLLLLGLLPNIINYAMFVLGLIVPLIISYLAFKDLDKYIEEVKVKPDYTLYLTKFTLFLTIIFLLIFPILGIYYIIESGNIFMYYNNFITSLPQIIILIESLIFYFVISLISIIYGKFRKSESYDGKIISTPKSSFIIGHQNSGKTVLGLGLYKIATDKYDGDLILSKPISVSLREGAKENLLNVLSYMVSEGKYYRGTEKSEFIINTIEIPEELENKIIYGKENLLINFVDYGGEYLDDVSKILTGDLLEEYVDNLCQILEEEGQNSDEISKIKNDALKLKFDYLKYDINWSSLPISHLKYSAPIYILSCIKNAEKLIFLIDGKQILPLFMHINPEFALNLKKNDEELYRKLLNENTNQFLNDISSYITILTSKELNLRGKPKLFVVTKSDEIIKIYGKMVGVNYSDMVVKYEKEAYDDIKEQIIDLILEIDHIKQLIKSAYRNVNNLNEYIKLCAIIPQKGKLIILGVDEIIEWLKK